jgi:hypothetical protein
MTNDSADAPRLPSSATPDARLRALDKLLGTWSLRHRTFDTGEEWGGQDRFAWLEGGCFLAFYHAEFGHNLKGVMLIGYERKWGEDQPSNELIGHWFESSSGNHFVYIWEVSDDRLTFWLEQKGSDSAFQGRFSEDGNTISGAWKCPGGYELTMTRLPNEKQ